MSLYNKVEKYVEQGFESFCELPRHEQVTLTEHSLSELSVEQYMDGVSSCIGFLKSAEILAIEGFGDVENELIKVARYTSRPTIDAAFSRLVSKKKGYEEVTYEH